MKQKIIFIIVSLYLLTHFLSEVIVYLSSLSQSEIRIPFASIIGFVTWIGMVLRKRWGSTLLVVYFWLHIYSLIPLLIDKESRVFAIGVSLVSIAMFIALIKYTVKNSGIPWNKEAATFKIVRDTQILVNISGIIDRFIFTIAVWSTIIFISLKLLGIIDWYWRWITSPVWIWIIISFLRAQLIVKPYIRSTIKRNL